MDVSCIRVKCNKIPKLSLRKVSAIFVNVANPAFISYSELFFYVCKHQMLVFIKMLIFLLALFVFFNP